MANACIVLTTVGDKQKAEEFAEQMVQRRLAACVNIVGPIRSVFRWKGSIEREEEYLLLIKTTSDQASRLGLAFEELHPYDLPERVELSIEAGSESYLGWIAEEVAGD